jgi:7-cyano-7-deazaguanine synthase
LDLKGSQPLNTPLEPLEKKAVVLLSGGLDSTTTAALARSQGFAVYALSFDYGQRHAVELRAAQRVAKALDVRRHLVLRADMTAIGGSALTAAIAVPKAGIDPTPTAIPVTYVPARNTIFLAYALAWAEVLGTGDIFIGVNALDYSGYPDCRPEYLQAFEHMANLATKQAVEGRTRVRIHTPLLQLTKARIIGLGTDLGVDYALTHSCYDPSVNGLACGRCDSCRLRRKGFAEAGLTDPVRYQHES